MKACFVTMPFPGVRRIGEEGQKLGLWDLVMLDGDSTTPLDQDLYILGAWHGFYDYLLAHLPGKRVGVCWTSSAAEMELNAKVEFSYLQAILQDPRISFVWFGDPGLAQVFPEKGFHYPYPLKYEAQPTQPKQNIITLFCPDKPSKNVYAQLLAVSIAQREHPDLLLHTNIQNLRGLEGRLNVVQHGWLPTPEYHQLLSSARLNLACSFAETMCYQAAEAVMLGTASLVSPAVPWAPWHSDLMCKSTDVRPIAYHLSRQNYSELRGQQQNLQMYAEHFKADELLARCALDASALHTL